MHNALYTEYGVEKYLFGTHYENTWFVLCEEVDLLEVKNAQ